MVNLRPECTASISISSTGPCGSSGAITPVTRKCFSRFTGVAAVHFVSSSLRELRRLVAGIAIAYFLRLTS